MNQYCWYSYAAQDFKTACDDKILVDLARLKNLKEFDEVDAFITNNFGQIQGENVFNYPNNIAVIIEKSENIIAVGALQDEKQIFGLKWKYVPND